MSANESRNGAFLDQFMPTEPPVHCALEVDLERWATDGVNTLFVDVEDTLGLTGKSELNPELVEHINLSRNHGIKNVAVFTNKAIDDQKDRRLLSAWGEQLGAELVLTPLSGAERKPSPLMIYKGLGRFGIRPEQAGVIGDKATAEIRAGFFAGLEHRAWTRPFGEGRHMGDRIFRDPFEALLRVRAHLKLTPVTEEQLGVASTQINELIAEHRVEEVIARMEEALPDGRDNIVGHGIDDIAVPEEILRTIQQPAYRKALEEVRGIYSYYSDEPAQRLKDYLHENGRNLADAMIWVRLAAAFGIAVSRSLSVDAETALKLQAKLSGVAYVTDAVDGPFARGHKHGATAKGAADDQNVDKLLAFVIDVFALLPNRLVSKTAVGLTIGRDVGLTALRRPFKARGIDTKSVRSGKNATLVKGIAQNVGLFAGQRTPRLNRALQMAAVGLKLSSGVQAPFEWVKLHEQKQHDLRANPRLSIS